MQTLLSNMYKIHCSLYRFIIKIVATIDVTVMYESI